MERLKIVFENREKFWSDKFYTYVDKTIYLYSDNINNIVKVERKGVVNNIYFNEISAIFEIKSDFLPFIIESNRSPFNFFKKGIEKDYNFKGDFEMILCVDLKNIFKELSPVYLSINYIENKLNFLFNSELEFTPEINRNILNLIDKLIELLKQ